MDTSDKQAIPDVELEEEEEILLNGFGRERALWLTSYRLILGEKSQLLGRRRKTTFIDLDDITAMSIGFIRDMRLLVIGTVLVIAGVITRALLPSGFADSIWMLGIVVTIFFVLSGRRGIVIKAARSEMRIKTSGAKADQVREFVFTLEDARNRLMGIEGDAEGAGIRAGGLPASDDRPAAGSEK